MEGWGLVISSSIILMCNLNCFIELFCFGIPMKERFLIFHVKLECPDVSILAIHLFKNFY